MLIGNLTRDPELRYTPGGVAVASFGLATNRRWTAQTGEQKEDAQFHRIVAWNKLGELCSQLLTKGKRVYVEGRLQHKEWTGNDGIKRKDTEIIISDMIILDSRQAAQKGGLETGLEKPAAFGDNQEIKIEQNEKPKEKEKKKEAKAENKTGNKTGSKTGNKAGSKEEDDQPPF